MFVTAGSLPCLHVSTSVYVMTTTKTRYRAYYSNGWTYTGSPSWGMAKTKTRAEDAMFRHHRSYTRPPQVIAVVRETR